MAHLFPLRGAFSSVYPRKVLPSSHLFQKRADAAGVEGALLGQLQIQLLEAGVLGGLGGLAVLLLPPLLPAELLPQGQGQGGGQAGGGAFGAVPSAGDEKIGGGQAAEGQTVVPGQEGQASGAGPGGPAEQNLSGQRRADNPPEADRGDIGAGTPDTGDSPGRAGIPGTGDTPGRAGTPDTEDIPGRAGRGGTPDRADTPGM